MNYLCFLRYWHEWKPDSKCSSLSILYITQRQFPKYDFKGNMLSIDTILLFPLPSVLIWPETLHNLHSYHTPLSYLLVCVSTGQSTTHRDKECACTLRILVTGVNRESMQFSCSQKTFSSAGCMFYAWRSPHQCRAQISCAVSMLTSDLFGNVHDLSEETHFFEQWNQFGCKHANSLIFETTLLIQYPSRLICQLSNKNGDVVLSCLVRLCPVGQATLCLSSCFSPASPLHHHGHQV